MKQKTQSRRPMVLSIVSIIACIAVLIGATFAWFTDTETNTGNRIQAGTLDAELYMYYGATSTPTAPSDWDSATEVPDATADLAAQLAAGSITLTEGWYQITDETPADFIFYFDNEVYAPGDSQEIYLAVRNAGSLALDYNLDFVVGSEALADALQFAYASAIGTVQAAPSTGYVTVSSRIEGDTAGRYIATADATTLQSQEVEYISFDLRLDESTGNTYQGLAFDMDLILTATQVGQSGEVVYAYSVADINAATEDQTVILMQHIAEDKAVALPYNVNFDLNGYTLTVPSFSMATDDICTVDIEGGDIVITGTIGTGAYSDKGMLIDVPNGTVNIDDTMVATNDGVVIDASQHTLNLTGTTQFVGTQENTAGETVADTTKPATVTIEDNTRVVSDTTESVTINVEAGTEGVVVSSGVAVTGDGEYVIDNGTSEGVTIPEGTKVMVNTAEEIIDAINNAQDGDVIVIAAGTYNIVQSGALTIATDNVTLLGMGKDETILVFDQSTITNNDPIYVNADNVTIANLTIDATMDGRTASNYGISFGGGKSNNTVTDFTMSNVKVIVEYKSWSAAAIYIGDAKLRGDIVIDSCEVVGSSITVCSNDMEDANIVITNNTITDSPSSGISVFTLSPNTAGSVISTDADFTIENNKINNYGTIYDYASGISFHTIMTDASINGVEIAAFANDDVTSLANANGDTSVSVANIKRVTTSAQLTYAVDWAENNPTIIVADGTYDVYHDATGTPNEVVTPSGSSTTHQANNIQLWISTSMTLVAENPLGATIMANKTCTQSGTAQQQTIYITASDVVVDGFVIENVTSNKVIEIQASTTDISDITIQNCKVDYTGCVLYIGANTSTPALDLYDYYVLDNEFAGYISVCNGAGDGAIGSAGTVSGNTFSSISFSGTSNNAWSTKDITYYPTITGNTITGSSLTVDGVAYQAYVRCNSGYVDNLIPEDTMYAIIEGNTMVGASSFDCKTVYLNGYTGGGEYSHTYESLTDKSEYKSETIYRFLYAN